MIRRIEERDLPALRALQGEYEWKFGSDFMEGLVLVDAEDRPVMFAGAWSRAEVHALVDPAWSSPGARNAAFTALHEAMEVELKRQGVGYVVTWMDGMRAFARRMVRLGWVKGERQSWLRKVN